VYSAAWRYGTTSGCKLEGRLMGLDAGMQQPTACRKYEGDRVRRVAPKLIANGESHALRSRESAQLGASGLGSHVAVKSTRGWRGGRRTGRRRRATAERHAEKITFMIETHVCSRNASRAPWRKAPERTRWIPCARAVRCARAAIAPTHTLSTASNGTCTRTLRFCARVFRAARGV